jgi:hypothetical protein
MIKLFRKIRQKLLTENKFSKYLIYAIGEIILVVIGIFIAIQLNNLNEERKQTNKENEYYCKLLEDIQQDLIQIDKLIVESEIRIESSNQFLSLVQQENLNSKRIANKMLEAISLVTYTFKPNIAAFEDIKSSGNLAILKDEKIKSKLVEYYSTVEGIVDVVDINADGSVSRFYDKTNYVEVGWHQIDFVNEAIDTTIVDKSILNGYIEFNDDYRRKLTSDAVYYIGSSARIKMLYTLLKKEIALMKIELERKCS